jgi:hypothetical protein
MGFCDADVMEDAEEMEEDLERVLLRAERVMARTSLMRRT